MAIVRVIKDKNNPYVMLNKEFLQSENLTWKAKGLLAYILSLPDNWVIHESEIITHAKDGEKSSRSGFKELIKEGYIHRIQLREKGKFVGYEYHVTEFPTALPKPEYGDAPEDPKTALRETACGKTEYRKTGTTNKQQELSNDNTNNNNNIEEAEKEEIVVAPVEEFLEELENLIPDISIKSAKIIYKVSKGNISVVMDKLKLIKSNTKNPIGFLIDSIKNDYKPYSGNIRTKDKQPDASRYMSYNEALIDKLERGDNNGD